SCRNELVQERGGRAWSSARAEQGGGFRSCGGGPRGWGGRRRRRHGRERGHGWADSRLERSWDCVCLPPCRAASTPPWPPHGSPRPVTTSLVSISRCPRILNPTVRGRGAVARSRIRGTRGGRPM